MAIDEAIQKCFAQRGQVYPTLRFLSMGNLHVFFFGRYFQDVKKEVEVGVLEELGIDLVRRPTEWESSAPR